MKKIMSVICLSLSVLLICGAMICYIDAGANEATVYVSAESDEEKVDGIRYYVSNSGSDANDGKSEQTPFKTVGKLNALALNKSDSVLFKRGDAFYGETFIVNGSGSEINPIKIGANGSGAKPILAARTLDAPCILIQGREGIEITGLELAESYQGISVEFDRVFGKRYMRFEDLYIRDMLRGYNSAPGEYNHTSCGITVRGVREKGSIERYALENLIVRNINFYNVEIAFWGMAKIGREFVPEFDYSIVKNVLVENLYVERGNMWGASFTFMENFICRNVNTLNTGLSPNNYGSCGLLFGYSKNVLIENCSVVNQFINVAQGFDACGVDFEGQMENVVFRNNLVENTAGCSLFITYNGSMESYDFIIENNTFKDWAQSIGDNQAYAVLVFDNRPQYLNNSIGVFRNNTLINGRTNFALGYVYGLNDMIIYDESNTEQAQPHYTLDFTGEGNTMGLDGFSQQTTGGVTASGGNLRVDFADVNGGVNELWTPNLLRIDGLDMATLKIKLKNSSAATRIRVYFIPSTTSRFLPDNYVDVAITAFDSGFKEYTVDMAQNYEYEGAIINRLKFCFETVEGFVEIDEIEIR